MTDYFKYLLSPFILSLHAWGMLEGGAFAWLGFGVIFWVLLFDAFLKPSHHRRDTRFPWVYDIIITCTVLACFANIFLYAHLAGGIHFGGLAPQLGAFLGSVMIGFVIGAPPVHELFHRENMALRTLGRIGQCLVFDPWREITHVVTHHMHTATPTDPDYARRGDTVYGHFTRTFPGQWKESYHLEKMMWTKRGRKWYDLRNAWVFKATYFAVFIGALFALGGVKGGLLACGSLILGPRMMLEVFNYCNHYGLVSATPGRFKMHHTWNHLTPFTRILALEITNHAGHHDDSYKPFYELEPDETGPKQPPFILCVIAAFVPPLFMLMMKPLLKHWDEHYANDQEREIGARENARAGWHELNNDESPTTPSAGLAAA
ncbi:MAG: hypothetical protein ACI8RU_001960 [Zhongshania aliphaticivorans]|jgi:alkane 1-monooxygenase/p-cymene monooxygenase|uniref:hypothetical protein n=1 Tax=Zhongshania aliphaticivorans TaxID=1470434 RepID=UPI0039E42151